MFGSKTRGHRRLTCPPLPPRQRFSTLLTFQVFGLDRIDTPYTIHNDQLRSCNSAHTARSSPDVFGSHYCGSSSRRLTQGLVKDRYRTGARRRQHHRRICERGIEDTSTATLSQILRAWSSRSDRLSQPLRPLGASRHSRSISSKTRHQPCD